MPVGVSSSRTPEYGRFNGKIEEKYDGDFK